MGNGFISGLLALISGPKSGLNGATMKILPQITKPCHQNWDAMTGDEKKRYCSHCRLHVHNLSAMTPEEQLALLARRDEKSCITYLEKGEAMRVCTDNWVAVQRFFRPFRRMALSLSAIAVALLTSCGTPSARRVSPPKPPPSPPPVVCEPVELDGKRVMGAPVFYDPPLWRRILFFWER